MQAGAKFTHILELTFKQQIFVIFIVDYFYQKEFFKSKNFKFVDNPFKGQDIYPALIKNVSKKKEEAEI